LVPTTFLFTTQKSEIQARLLDTAGALPIYPESVAAPSAGRIKFKILQLVPVLNKVNRQRDQPGRVILQIGFGVAVCVCASLGMQSAAAIKRKGHAC
jgi:4-hydroxy-3-methylbut-2-en-1-yl diphosphate synthase IspG/GcpE